MKRLSILTAALLFCGQAFAVNSINFAADLNYANKTYSAQINDITPAAAATDVITISGVAGKVIRVNRIELTGDATSNSILDFYLYKRTTLNTGGTSTYQLPAQHDSLYPVAPVITNSGFVVGQAYAVAASSTACTSIGAASNTVTQNFIATGTSASTCIATKSASAPVKLYSANPSALGIGTMLRGIHYPLASTGTALPWVEDFGTRTGQTIVLRGPNESLAVNLAGQSIPSNTSLYALIEWTEE